MKRFVFSDSHGGYKAMLQCLERCGFNNDEDQLFFLGDVVDGWSETKESIELLLGIKNLVYLLGNHDQWAIRGYTGNLFKPENQQELEAWVVQGGAATLKSYGFETGMPNKHLQFLLNAKAYHITEDNIVMVHAGFDPDTALEITNVDYLIWSRNFINKYYGLYYKNKQKQPDQPGIIIPQFKEVYLGHTPTIRFDPSFEQPINLGNIILMDTGAAFSGCLSIMDIDSKEVWQSDVLMTLYPDETGRNGISWNDLQQKTS